jgi:YVTN family beta-propeller protein
LRVDTILKKKNNLFLLLLILIPTTFVILANLSSYFEFNFTRLPALAQEDDNIARTAKGVLYVGNAKSNSISVIDLTTNKLVKNITVGSGTHDIKISDDQQVVYTTDIDSGTVSIVNATNNMLMNQIDTSVAVHGVAIFNDTLYVGDVYGGKVLVIKNNAIKDEIKVGSGPEYVELRPPDRKVLYVANLWSPISVVDLAEEKGVIKNIDSGKTPHGLSFTNDGSRLFIVNMHSNTLSVIDAQKHEIIKTIPVGKNPEYVKLFPDESFAYITNLGEDTVSKIDLRTLEVINKIPVGKGPHGIAFSADADLAYISNMKGNDVSVIDTSTDKVITTIPAGGIEPHQIIIKKPFVKIISSDNSTVIPPVYIDVSDDRGEQSIGLMFRKSLEWNNGMLFVFEDESNLSFWMKNTYIPLDMIFVDKDFRIVDINQNAQPCIEEKHCPSYSSKQPAKYVLEVNAGFVKQNKIKIGDTVDL